MGVENGVADGTSWQERCFSKERLSGYDSLEQHEQNLRLIGEIASRLGIFEVVLRNRVVEIVKAGLEVQSVEAQNSVDLDKFTSEQTLGFWVKIVKLLRIENKIFDASAIKKIDFRKYSRFNKARFSDGTSLFLERKATAILSLVTLVRNRAFHFENLLKLNDSGKPRLATKVFCGEMSLVLSVAPDKIEVFLDDVLGCFDERLKQYAKK